MFWTTAVLKGFKTAVFNYKFLNVYLYSYFQLISSGIEQRLQVTALFEINKDYIMSYSKQENQDIKVMGLSV